MFEQLITFFLLGLIIGSFLNVLVYRLKDGGTFGLLTLVTGRSYCPHCKHQVRWYDNIPLVSFLLLKGVCRDCGEKISFQYPVVEGLTGLMFAIVGALFFSFADPETWMKTFLLLALVSVFIALATYDLKYMEIPVPLLIGGGVFAFFFILPDFQSASGLLWWMSPFMLGVFGSLAVAFFFLALVLVSHETWMGWGDVWLGAIAGLVVGLPLALFMLTLSFGAGALVGVGKVAFQGKTLKSQVPFAPFLVFGTLASLFLSQVFPNTLRFFQL